MNEDRLNKKQELMDQQVKHFEERMAALGIEYGYKNTYPPYSFKGKTLEMTVLDTDIGIYAVDKNYKIYLVGSEWSREGYVETMTVI